MESGSELEERVRLDVVVREEAERSDDAAREAGVGLEVDAPIPLSVTGSARDLSLLVHNLIDNAVRYTRPGGRVEVGVEEAPDGVVLSVCDTGVGIPTATFPASSSASIASTVLGPGRPAAPGSASPS